MLFLQSTLKDIYFNLATEEFLLKNRSEDVFMLWQSDACIVVGKHQNAMAEINHSYIRQHHILIARRLTGGGTVYHGEGNLNFTFIRKGQPGKLVDFNYFVSPIVDYLATLGIDAEIGKKNDILIEGMKISGNAEHVYRDRVLHHGTLLYNADLNALDQSIKVIAGRYRDKAVQSNRAVVTNITRYLQKPLSLEEFQGGLLQYMMHYFPEARAYRLTPAEEEEIEQLRNSRYATEEWIFGYSPEFTVTGKFDHQGASHTLRLRVHKSQITECELIGPGGSVADHLHLLKGKRFDFERLGEELTALGISPELKEKVLRILF